MKNTRVGLGCAVGGFVAVVQIEPDYISNRINKLPTKTKVGSGTSQSKSETSLNVSYRGIRLWIYLSRAAGLEGGPR